MPELKPCPFCGCSIEIRKFFFLNGDEGVEPYGFHDPWCVLEGAIWATHRWTEDKLVKSWNSRQEYKENENDKQRT